MDVLERKLEHTLNKQLDIYRCRLRLKCDAKRTKTRFRPSAKRTSLFKSAGASV